jgi:hypothetical protein
VRSVLLPGEGLDIGDPRAEPLDGGAGEGVAVLAAEQEVDVTEIGLGLRPRPSSARQLAISGKLQQAGDRAAVKIARTADHIVVERHDEQGLPSSPCSVRSCSSSA